MEPRMRRSKYMMFCEFLANHPTLYDGVNLDKTTIDYLNNHFYEYNVNVEDFERHYLQNLRRAVGIYNNLKSIELNDRIFDVTTNATIRNIASNTLQNLKDGGTTTTNRTPTGNKTTTYTPSGTYADTTTNNSTKTLKKTLPMNYTRNSGFDNFFNWDAGASEGSESQNNPTQTRSYNNYQEVTKETYDEDYNDKTTIEHNLKKLGTIDTTNSEDSKSVNGQIVTLVKNIWDYLITPKAIDYLTDELEKSFVLVF